MRVERTTLNCRGKLLDLAQPVVMGIINVTPDSFYKASRISNLDSVCHRVSEMIRDGAAIIDIGGASSRPGAETISPQEEIDRVTPFIEKIHAEFDVIISIDTFQSKVVKSAYDAGASVINDISAGEIDKEMIPTVSTLYQTPYILMHMKGEPQNMQKNIDSNTDIVIDIIDFFIKKIGALENNGIYDIVLDLGFGFGKSIQQNYQLLHEMSNFNFLNRPILTGVSRKSMIYKTLNISPEESLIGTAVLQYESLKQGAKILRTHDVKEATQTIKLFNAIEQSY